MEFKENSRETSVWEKQICSCVKEQHSLCNFAEWLWLYRELRSGILRHLVLLTQGWAADQVSEYKQNSSSPRSTFYFFLSKHTRLVSNGHFPKTQILIWIFWNLKTGWQLSPAGMNSAFRLGKALLLNKVGRETTKLAKHLMFSVAQHLKTERANLVKSNARLQNIFMRRQFQDSKESYQIRKHSPWNLGIYY